MIDVPRPHRCWLCIALEVVIVASTLGLVLLGPFVFAYLLHLAVFR